MPITHFIDKEGLLKEKEPSPSRKNVRPKSIQDPHEISEARVKRGEEGREGLYIHNWKRAEKKKKKKEGLLERECFPARTGVSLAVAS